MSSVIRKMVTTLEKPIIKSKFRGSMLGALIGDCLGAPYEGDTVSSGERIIIQRYFDKLEDPNFKGIFRQYTDDTAMTKSVAKFLIDKPEPDYKFLAKLFVNEYFSEPKRGYGQNVVEVFHKLKKTKYEDVFQPANQQFMGSGSYGNGGAMRIAPIALYFYDNYDQMIDVARNSTKITHTNILGINGALLQCLAVRMALLSDNNKPIDSKKFCSELRDQIKDIEKSEDDEDSDPVNQAYQEKLSCVEHLLSKKDNDELDDEVILTLGHGISAYESVPTAIYCFLRAQNNIPAVETDNIFRRTIQYAITLGGDTDTIASMAGAIAGAYLGEDSVNTVLMKQCEFHKETIELADNLFEAKGYSDNDS